MLYKILPRFIVFIFVEMIVDATINMLTMSFRMRKNA